MGFDVLDHLLRVEKHQPADTVVAQDPAGDPVANGAFGDLEVPSDACDSCQWNHGISWAG